MSNIVTVTATRREIDRALNFATMSDRRFRIYAGVEENEFWTGSRVRVEGADGCGFDVGTITPGVGAFPESDCTLTLNPGRIPGGVIGRVISLILGEQA